jgi:hypothetical protein
MGEPFSYRDQGEKYFRDRFNAMHAGYGNSPSKSSYAPALPDLPEDADLPCYFESLSEHYPIFGEKIALGNPRGDNLAQLKLWIERHRPHCLFVFRAPQSTLASMPRLFPHLTPQENIYSYAMTVRLYIDLARTLPNIRHIIHEDISAKTFDNLGKWLNADLSCAPNRYDIRHQAAPTRPAETAEVAALSFAYDFLSRQTKRHHRFLPWKSQIIGSLSGTDLGQINKAYAKLTQLTQNLSSLAIAA